MIPLPGPLEKMWRGEKCPPIVYHYGKEEAEERIRRKIIPFLSAMGRAGLRGSVKSGRISLYWNTPMFGNSWRPVFHGSIVSDGSGSRIEGTMSTFRLTQAFSLVWFGFLALLVVIGLPTVIFSLAAIAMLALGVGMVAFGQHLSRGEKEKIVSELRSL